MSRSRWPTDMACRVQPNCQTRRSLLRALRSSLRRNADELRGSPGDAPSPTSDAFCSGETSKLGGCTQRFSRERRSRGPFRSLQITLILWGYSLNESFCISSALIGTGERGRGRSFLRFPKRFLPRERDEDGGRKTADLSIGRKNDARKRILHNFRSSFCATLPHQILPKPRGFAIEKESFDPHSTTILSLCPSISAVAVNSTEIPSNSVPISRKFLVSPCHMSCGDRRCVAFNHRPSLSAITAPRFRPKHPRQTGQWSILPPQSPRPFGLGKARKRGGSFSGGPSSRNRIRGPNQTGLFPVAQPILDAVRSLRRMC